MKHTKHLSKKIALAVVVLLLSGGCNMFGWVDKPGTDEQKISAARAALDQGDILRALDLYKDLASGKDRAISEEAFAMLDGLGAGMNIFMEAIGKGGDGGAMITNLTDLLSAGPNFQTRKDLYTAYEKVRYIQDSKTRGLVRFVVAMVMIAVILGETDGNDNKLQKSDIATNPTSCKDAGVTACLTTTACNGVSGGLNGGGALGFDEYDNTRELIGKEQPHFGMIDGAIKAICVAIRDELGGSGKFGDGIRSSVCGISTSLNNNTATISSNSATGAQCFRYLLLNAGIGSDD